MFQEWAPAPMLTVDLLPRLSHAVSVQMQMARHCNIITGLQVAPSIPSPPPVRRFACNQCTFSTHDHRLLKQHSREHRKMHECTVCDFKTPHKTTMVRHTYSHTGEKPFACTECDFRASQKGHLTRHQRSHTNERPFACSLCPFRATQSGHLQRHFLKHTGEKPHVCTICGFRSNNQSNLTRHKKVHVAAAATALLKLCDPAPGKSGGDL